MRSGKCVGRMVGVLLLLHLAVGLIVPFILLHPLTFLPRTLGVLMAFGGLGWLTFLSPALAKSLSPYNLFPGILGEGALTPWLLIFGLNVQRWNEQASAVKPVRV